jgi:hypothetical protein
MGLSQDNSPPLSAMMLDWQAFAWEPLVPFGTNDGGRVLMRSAGDLAVGSLSDALEVVLADTELGWF